MNVAGQRASKKKMRSGSSSDTSRISVKQMELIFEKLKARQTRQSTANNYLAIWRKFNQFILRLDNVSGTSWEQKTILYGSYLVDQGVQSQTIKSYFSAIKHILRTDGYQWNDKLAMLDVITKSCRIINDQVKIRLPIRVNLLEQILFEVERYFDQQPYLESMYKAIFSIAYYGMMRIGEIAKSSEAGHYTRAKDVHVARNKNKVLIRLHTSKTHGKESKSQEIKIKQVPVMDVNKRFFCPFTMMRHFVAYRGAFYVDDNEPFFIFADRSPISPDRVRNTLRLLLQNLNLDQQLYDTQSLCSGRCVDMYKMGYSLEVLKRAGRWKSNAIYNYLKL